METNHVAEKQPPLTSHHRINHLEKRLSDAYKVREILIAVGKIGRDEFEKAEALVQDLAPDQPSSAGEKHEV